MRFFLGTPWAACAAAIAWIGMPAQAAGACQTIQFKPGTSSTELRGMAAPDPSGAGGSRGCYRFSTRQGQKVRMAVRSPQEQVAFTVDGVADNRDRLEFTSEKRVYEFTVYQTLRSTQAVPYVFTLSIL